MTVAQEDNTAPELTALLPGFDPTKEDIPDKIWASLAAYVAQPSDAAGQSSRVARLINGVARIAGNVADKNKKQEGALSREVFTTLLEAGRKAIPKTSTKRKVTLNQASSSAKRKKTQDNHTTTHAPSSEPAAAENATAVSGEECVAQEPQSPPTTPRSTKKSLWAAIVEKQPLNRVTGKPFVWLDNLTKVLMFMWGSPLGVDCVLNMVEAVYRDYDNLTLDATTSVSTSKSSVYTLEMRYKRVLSLSKAPALQTTELLLEYKNMADVADVSNTSIQACLQKLANAVPDLRQICDRLDKNFYRFLRIPGQITQLPKNCLQGMSVKKENQLSYTIAYLYAAPGEREDPGGMLNTTHLSHAGQKKTMTTTGQKEGKGAKGAKDGKGGKQSFYKPTPALLGVAG